MWPYGFCEKNVESIVHIFTTCDKIHIYRKTTVSVEFNLSSKAINYVILFMKQYLFSSLMLKKIPTARFNLMLKKYTAIQSFKLHNFARERDGLKNILE